MADKKVSKEVTENSVKFAFATGENVEVKPADFSAEIQRQLMLHGLSQKLGDSYSGEDAEKCHGIFQGVLKNLAEGSWSARSGGGSSRISQLAEALSMAIDQPIEACVEKLAGMSDEDKKSVRAHPDIKAALAQIKLKRAQEEAAAAKKEVKSAAGSEGYAPLTL